MALKDFILETGRQALLRGIICMTGLLCLALSCVFCHKNTEDEQRSIGLFPGDRVNIKSHVCRNHDTQCGVIFC